MLDLSFQYPAWFLIFCALLGLGYALLLYYRDSTFRERAPRLNVLLGVLRWLSVTIIAALLLAPLLKSLLVETKKPVVVLAQDQSESTGLELQGQALETYRANWQGLRDQLAEQYEVHEVAFGDEVREGVNFQFTDKVTNLSQLVRSVYDLYSGQNLGAVVLASDGIYNEGSNPAYTDVKLNAPVYSIAIGDTTPKKDLVLKRVFHNKIVYLGDQFTLQVDVAANNAAGAQTALSVIKIEGDQRQTIQNIPLSITGNDFFITKEITLEATKPGVAQYAVRLVGINGEASESNNSREIFIDVLDARQKILLLANSPHPDLSAIKQSLEGNKNYAVSIAYAGDPGLDVSRFDFVVLHSLPSRTNNIEGILNTLNSKQIPRLFVAGLQTHFQALNRAQNLVTMQGEGVQTDDVQGIVSSKFASFSLSPRLTEELPKFNPVVCAFGNSSALPSAQVVLYKRIGRINTEAPLLAVGEQNDIKTGVFMAEGLWKWRLFDFLQHQNHEIFDEFLGKSVQYLALKEDKRKFRINLDKNIYNENEPVVFGAELYNDNYELTNEPDVALSVRNAEGKEYTYTFNKIGKGYTLNAGILPTGSYTYKGNVNFNGQNLTAEGRFSVRAIQLELFETTANHAVLRQLSKQYGGETVSVAYMGSIAEKIKNNAVVKPVIYQTTQTNPLINLKWIFALLAVLLGLEWFLRRYYGAY